VNSVQPRCGLTLSWTLFGFFGFDVSKPPEAPPAIDAQREDAQASYGELRERLPLLLIACVLAVVGGYTDAYSYIAHGHVFANAQTGNVIFFAVYASDRQWRHAARHIPPIAAFILGVALAKLLGVTKQKHTFRATLLCQFIELLTLGALACAGNHLPDSFVVPAISFSAAIQITSLSAVGPWKFNSAMTTGNLRHATAAIVMGLKGHDREDNLSTAIVTGAIAVSFFAGALFGAFFTRIYERQALLPCIVLVTMGILLTVRERGRRIHSAA
jgi:uncharacterized membrane protein YoaK (UPF0700 family)